MGRRIIIIDIAIDQGGSTYFTRNAKAAQKHGQPPEAYFKYVHHSFIANMPSLEKQKASLAQEKVNLPYFSKLIAVGKDFVNDEVLASALNFVGGYNVVEVLKKDIGLKYIPLGKIKFE
jgi:alanine dehydrogenase